MNAPPVNPTPPALSPPQYDRSAPSYDPRRRNGDQALENDGLFRWRDVDMTGCSVSALDQSDSPSRELVGRHRGPTFRSSMDVADPARGRQTVHTMSNRRT
jgi:hypothetical protein